MSKLQKKLGKTSRGIVILGFVGALVLFLLGFLMGSSDVIEYLSSKNITGGSYGDLRSSSMENSINYYARDLVRLDVDLVLDYCATDDEGIYYLVPYAEKYMIVYIPFERTAEFQQLYDNSLEYEKGDLELGDWKPATVRGVVYPANDTVLQYANEMLVEYEYASDETAAAELIAPYTLFNSSLSDWTGVSTYILCGVSVLVFLAAVFGAVSVKPSFNKKLKKKDIPFEEIEEDLEVSYDAPSGMMGQRYTLISPVNISNIGVVRNSEILWAFLYTQTTTHTSYGIKTGTTYAYSVKLACKDGVIYAMPCGQKQADAKSYLDYIRANFPMIVVGHTSERAALFASNRAEFAHMAASGQHRNEILS